MVATPSNPSTPSTLSTLSTLSTFFNFHLSPFAFLLLSDERGEHDLKMAPEVADS
jgi:hypothetical protein